MTEVFVVYRIDPKNGSCSEPLAAFTKKKPAKSYCYQMNARSDGAEYKYKWMRVTD